MAKDTEKDTERKASDGSIEPEKKKSAFPKSLFFIIGNEFCERYSFYGMHTILILYLTIFLKFEDDTAAIIYHSFIAVSYFVPLIGGIIADSWLGKYKTIFYLSIVYTIGMLLNAISAIPQLGGYGKTLEDNIVHVALHLTGLVLIAIGTGGIKPCVSSFGGDQFEIPGQEEALSNFFGFFYFAINAGSLVSTFISPLMRETQCFDRDDCYFAAFIIPVGLMLISIILFVLGKRFYIIREPGGNVFWESCQITWRALREKCKNSGKRDHWLDWAKGLKWSDKTINDLKYVFPVAVMFIPLPFFWALFDMQGSRWTLTATQTNGYIFGEGSSARMLPDQAQIINPVLILCLIPVFSYGIYPLCEKCGIRVTDLRKMSAGMMISSLAFIISGFVQIAIDSELTAIPKASSSSSLVIYNAYPEEVTVSVANYWDGEYDRQYNLLPGGRTNGTYDNIVTNSNNAIEITVTDSSRTTTQLVELHGGEINNYVLTSDPEGPHIDDRNTLYYSGATKKSADGRIIFQITNTGFENVTLYAFDEPTCYDKLMADETDPCGKMLIEFPPMNTSMDLIDEYLVMDDHIQLKQNNWGFFGKFKGGLTCLLDVSEEKYLTGSIWSMLVTNSSTTQTDECIITTYQDSNENTVSTLALIPQFAVITIAEVLISVTGLEFAYTQAPLSMKSVLTSFWLLTVCFGNIIDIFIVSINFTELQSTEYFVFAALVAVAAVIFILLSMFYYEYVPEGQFYEETEAVEVEEEGVDVKVESDDVKLEVKLDPKTNPGFVSDELDTDKLETIELDTVVASDF